MADHDQQRLIELDANESPKVVFKVSSAAFLCLFAFYFTLCTPEVYPQKILRPRPSGPGCSKSG